MREKNEAAAHSVVRQLAELGITATVAGSGLHWRIEVAAVRSRSIKAHCFWYESAITGLVLGINPANARASLRAAVTPYEGLELATALLVDGASVAEGRTRTVPEFLAACRAWIAGATLDEMVTAAPFIGAELRVAKAFAARLDPRIRWDVEGDPSYALWAYDDAGRSCRAAGGACSFYLGQVQLAFGTALADVPGAMGAWLLDHVPPAALAAHGATPERHAETLLEDPARWHWLHVRDRIADPDDVLAPLAPLIHALAESPIASRFYTYSSMRSLCFSASSHYGWVGEFPRVERSGDGSIYVGETRATDIAHAVALIEAALAASPIEPFFGAAPDHELPHVVAAFARAGSAHVPALAQRGNWLSIVAAHGPRSCRFDQHAVTCTEGTSCWIAQCRTLDDAVAIALRFLDDRASTGELATDPRVERSF